MPRITQPAATIADGADISVTGMEAVMTRIRATCPMCGEVDLRPDDIHLDIIRDVINDVAEGSCYRFSCPTCAEMVTKPADERIARLLTTGGVSHRAPIDHGGLHPEVPRQDPALTLDDLISFHQLLETEGWYSGLEAMTR
jgi:predicted RNA-binding Zn-ribbon protein involved in translation (DUF1610 family)